jgi:hypothetical protein
VDAPTADGRETVPGIDSRVERVMHEPALTGG